MIRFSDSEKELRLSVHDVIDAGPPQGDLQLQVAWSSTTRMRVGQKIHTQYQQQAEDADHSFQREIEIKHLLHVHDWEIQITGRIDGLRKEDGVFVVEEIKSSTLPRRFLEQKTPEDMPTWVRQTELYVYFLHSQGIQARGELVVISVVDGTEHRLLIPENPSIAQFVRQQIEWLIEQREQQISWFQKRWEQAEAGLPFAHSVWREGQQAMSEALKKQLDNDRVVLLRAPTGYGKTAASLYAAFQTAYQTHKKIFFATARTTQQKMVEKTVDQLIKKGIPIRAVSIRSKEKACLNDRLACRPEMCPYASEYYDKVRQSASIEKAWETKKGLWPNRVKKIAQEVVICPYEFSINLAQQADIIIGDYNYLFDPNVQLSMISQSLKDWIVIVDEAHNLPPRAQGYGSPHLSLLKLSQAMELTGMEARFLKFQPPIEKAFDMVHHGLQKLKGTEDSFVLDDAFKNQIQEIAKEVEELALDYALLRLEQPFYSEKETDPWLDSAWSILKFQSSLARSGEETVGIWEKCGVDRYQKIEQPLFMSMAPVSNAYTGLSLLCRDPALFLSPFFAKIGAAVCMSATLNPFDFYENLLGIPQERKVLQEYSSPFPIENRAAFVLPQIKTTYATRSYEHPRIALLLQKIIEATPGNIAVFFSSFAVLEDITNRMELDGIDVLIQKPRMKPSERNQLLRTMKEAQGHALFAVMGGIFSEGVDLPGDALVTAVMVGPSLPMADLSRRLMQEWYEQQYGEGFRYAWVIPGMARVAQAAGRVIRSEKDKGVVILIGKRFSDHQFRELFPTEWNLQETSTLGNELQKFWEYTE